jgi:hypothetical protein
MDDLDETVLSIQQRQKRAQIMRRNKSKIERAREIAKKKMAPEANIRKRAFVQARQLIRRRVAGSRGAEYEKLGPSEKMAIDRAVEGKQKVIKKLALRLIPRVKQAESKRLHAFMKGQQIQNHGQPEGKSKESSGESSVKESLNALFNEAFPPSDVSTAMGQKVDSPVTSSTRKMPPKGKSKNDVIIQHNKFNEEVENDTPAFASLFKKSEKSGIDLEVLGEVYNRGWNTWVEGSNVSQQQYAFARVNSYINQGKTYFNEDADLHEGRAPGRAYVAPFNDEQGNQKGWKSSNKWGKVKYWQPHAKKSAMKHAGLQEEEVQQTNENFMDGKGPGKPGDSARHGLKGKSAAELRKIRSSDSASPRKKQLAHWMLNMHHNEDVNEADVSKFNIPMSRPKPKKAPTRTFGSVLDEVDVPIKHLDRARNVWNRTKDVEAVKKFVSSVKEDLEEKRGLWDNIHAKRARIKAGSGERMRKPGSEGAPTKQNFKDASESVEDTGNGTALVNKVSTNSKARKRIEVIDRKPPHTEFTRLAQIKTKIIENKACPICEGKGCKCKGNVQNDPKKREIGTDSLVKAYKADTPYANESINESFNIAFASGVGVTLTAADLGMRAQGGFALHPSVVEQMDEMEEEARSADVKGVVVRTASGKTVVRKQKVNHKIIGTGNLTDGKPDDTV